ncbi:MAG: hypothetical protein DRQ49_17950 [Gammaproteobacteria bacterium]|nr:MAG: hypothetical protein DRQ49_17950 [Gammaproteobacteria bacterium]RKZ72933.1 MAG: hypothetical protein DRQ57_16025 [Gammaproteobacteria bacterium]
MKMKCYAQLSLVPVLLSSPLPLLAGDLDSPDYPNRADSSMYTIDDIYNRLDTGEEADAPSSAFTEPDRGPSSGTGHTLTELYQKADEVMDQARVQKTGQTKRYETDDDGDLEKGVTWPNPRFSNNYDGTVTDNMTGLTWLKNANCANNVRDWENALDDVANLNANGTMNGNNCGVTDRRDDRRDNRRDDRRRDDRNNQNNDSDWRLPNVKELQSLIDFSQAGPALENGHPFSDVQMDGYWSSTTNAYIASRAWYVLFEDGIVMNTTKSNTRYVWPVRGSK